MSSSLVKATGTAIVFLFLTVLTQIGGLVLLCWLPAGKFIDKIIGNRLLRKAIKCLGFIGLYLSTTFIIVPILAKPFGRVPLPILSNTSIQPLTIWTCLLNRHYARPALKQALEKTACRMSKLFPSTRIAYLDANFPFLDKFPLFPHLSHNDGRKLDLAFFYQHAASGKQLNGEAPSAIGYGVYESPLEGELNTPLDCARRGYWQYGFLEYLVPQANKKNMRLDAGRTKQIIKLLAAQPSIDKIFIEPHLKARMNLQSAKIRFHGCQAVRHDDHIHIQIK